MKMNEEDRNRYNILIDRGNEVFERMENRISNLNSRNIALIGIILPILSIVLTLVLYLLQEGWQPSDVDIFLLIVFILFLVISLVINISIFHPTDYEDLNVFGKTGAVNLLGVMPKLWFFQTFKPEAADARLELTTVSKQRRHRKTTFDKLISNSEQDLLSHFLYHLKGAYRYNVDKYERRMWWFTVALCMFIAANITFIILIVKNIVWR